MRMTSIAAVVDPIYLAFAVQRAVAWISRVNRSKVSECCAWKMEPVAPNP